MVDWTALQTCLMHMSRLHQLTYYKFLHGLLNTNEQNHRYYQQSDLYPHYQSATESFQYVLSCPQPEVKKYWEAQQVLLWKSLWGLSTPPTVLDYFKRGILYGICGPNTDSEDLLPDTQSVSSSASVASLDLPSSLASEASRQQTMALG
jgi:hypothetical protein